MRLANAITQAGSMMRHSGRRVVAASLLWVRTIAMGRALAKARACAGWMMRRARRWMVAAALLAVVMVMAAGWWLIRAGRGPELHAPEASDSSTISVVAVQPAPRPTQVVGFAQGCVNPECHAFMAGGSARASPSAIHEPVARQMCDACHAPDSGGHVFPLLRTGDDLCGNCHQTGAQATFPHKAMTDDSYQGCLACHDAHTSAGRFLLIGQTPEQTCLRCHPTAAGRQRHLPYATGLCEVCHEPHGSETAALLRSGDGSDAGGIEGHCRMCHEASVEAMSTAPHSHRTVDRSCLTCHGAHATEWKWLQKSESRRGCIACHEDVGKVVSGALVSHDAVLTGDECVSCHEPHASSNAMMLRTDQTPVCLKCHSKSVVAADGRKIPEMATAITAKPLIHGPVAAGNCAACHSVHGGQHARLLKELNPNVLVGGFDIRNYALCFACHDQNLVLAETGAATQFRNGDVNLHRVHVQSGERSRSCATCHAVHSSDRPRLIAETVAYDGSNWRMAMGFFLTADGGGCSPGCHEPLRYSRSSRRDSSEKNERSVP